MPTRTSPTEPSASPDVEHPVEAMALVVFQSGMGARVVDAKWDDIDAAFGGFDPDETANLTSFDIDRLCSDPRVIRNRRRLEAIVHNARVLIDWEQADGVRRSLVGLASDDDRASEVISRLNFVGPTGAHEFLWRIGVSSDAGCEL